MTAHKDGLRREMGESMNDHYVKALSVRNIADMVYACQVFHEWGMPPGVHLTRMYDEVLAIPDKGWIVWLSEIEPTYTWLTDEQFREQYTLYDDLPPAQKDICDAHPSYDEWLEEMDRQFDQKEGVACH
jgi:hypothetical protein